MTYIKDEKTRKLLKFKEYLKEVDLLMPLGVFTVNDLPVLDGFDDVGKIAFVKDTRKYATWDGYGWTYMDGKPVTPRYLTFTANEDGSHVLFFRSVKKVEPTHQAPVFEYSTDGGETWQPYTIDDGESAEAASGSTIVNLRAGDSVLFRGTNEILSEGKAVFIQCSIRGRVGASGDITSLLNGVGGDATLTANCYYAMFYDCTGLTQAPALPATTLAEGCYGFMFGGCIRLTEAPALPATTLASECYYYMFNGCTGLTEAPALPATTLASECYYYMFYGCTGLTKAPALPATTLAEGCYGSMFYGCTGLTQAPALPATTLATNCYSSMFYGCEALTQAPALPATTLAEGCYNSMFRGCTNITSHDVATLDNSANVFGNNSSCASLTIHAENPPMIASNTINGLKADCIIYVPAASVDAYKAAQYWSARSSYIQAIH